MRFQTDEVIQTPLEATARLLEGKRRRWNCRANPLALSQERQAETWGLAGRRRETWKLFFLRAKFPACPSVILQDSMYRVPVTLLIQFFFF